MSKNKMTPLVDNEQDDTSYSTTKKYKGKPDDTSRQTK